MNPSRASVWVISDGRRGIENQALGLAEALSRLTLIDINRKIIGSDPSFAALPSWLQYLRRSKPVKYSLAAPFPDIAIGCGRQAIAPLRSLKAANPSTFLIYIQDPRSAYKTFDLIIAPEHDKLSHPNAVSMIGSPNRVTAKTISAAQTEFSQKLAQYKPPFTAFLIGGLSKNFSLNPKDHDRHIQIAQHVLDRGHTLLVTLSRRTPHPTRRAWHSLASTRPETIWLYDTETESHRPNPYFAFLGAADHIYVTQDSTNMLTEAACTGTPITALPMTGQAGKFAHLYSALKSAGALQELGSASGATRGTYTPLGETDRVAKIVYEKTIK